MEIKSQSVMAADGNCLGVGSYHRTATGVDSYPQDRRSRHGTASLRAPFGKLLYAADDRHATVDLRDQHQCGRRFRPGVKDLIRSVQDINSRNHLDPQAVSAWMTALPLTIARRFAWAKPHSTGRGYVANGFPSVAHLDMALCEDPSGHRRKNPILFFGPNIPRTKPRQ